MLHERKRQRKLAGENVMVNSLPDASGYTPAEARLALRESQGNLNAEVHVIEMKERKKLGKCINGDCVDPQFHKAAMAVGCSSKIASWSLFQSHNNICQSISLLQKHPEQIPHQGESITDDSIQQVCSTGFEYQQAKHAIQKFKGIVAKAVEELVINKGKVFVDLDSSSDSTDDSEPSTSKKKHDEAYSQLSDGVSRFEEDHLVLNLMAEKAFLNKYRDLLSKR
ncbi:hypothetical protein RUM44_007597 [Polyplax serrata]|uniref:Uncharacterized protein n=1 Tax=Polyplax serrata TaxID=468196 RepID=A0ABR1BAU8_POLSC